MYPTITITIINKIITISKPTQHMHQQFINQSRLLSLSILFIHYGLQLVVSYWSTQIDGYTCYQQFLYNVTYFGYAFIIFNLISIGIANSRFLPCGQYSLYINFVVNLGVMAGVFFFAISGLLRYATCASSRVLFQYWVIQSSVCFVLSVIVMFGKLEWSDLYVHWPGNLAWPILFLKTGFPTPLFAAAIVIGVIYIIICLSSFILHILLSLDKKSPYLKTHWYVCLVLILGTLITGIVLCCVYGKDGDYYWSYGRKVVVIFCGVSFVDLAFWLFGLWRARHWKMFT